MNKTYKQDNPIESEVDFDADGFHKGYLRLPWSSDRSAYGWLPIPIACAKNGNGPRVLLLAGNHGDEYEGQVVLSELMRILDIERVNGQIIIAPAINAPAAFAHGRTSPIDGGNLNRLFPGNPAGQPTQMIADYVENVLLAKADYMLDLHSGGQSLEYVQTALLTREPDETRNGRKTEILASLGTPYGLWFPGDANSVYSSSAALRQGVLSVTVETGGGGQLAQETVDAARAVTYRFLRATGVYDKPGICYEVPAPRVFHQALYTYANCGGLFEPLVSPGDEVQAGQPAALIHQVERPAAAPLEIVFENAGTVLCKRSIAPVVTGDCLYQLGT